MWGQQPEGTVVGDTACYCSSAHHYVICSLLNVAQSSPISTEDRVHVGNTGAAAARVLRKSYGHVTLPGAFESVINQTS